MAATETTNIQKIRTAINKAISILDQNLKSEDAAARNVEDVLWSASEETEYSAAILSLIHGFTDFNPEVKDHSLLKADAKGRMSSAKSLLLDSERLLESNPSLSYEKLRYVVQILRTAKPQRFT
jgi:hypothetical protein